jgi:hypothetical protein
VTQTIESPFLGELAPKSEGNDMEREPERVSATPFVGNFTLTRSRYSPQSDAELLGEDSEEIDDSEIDDSEIDDSEIGDSEIDDEEAPEMDDLELLGETPWDTELDEDAEGVFDAETGFDPASNEGGSFELADAPGDGAEEIPGFDRELFQQLVSLGPVVEQALVTAQIVAGQRDVNELTNFVFFIRHPELKGTRLAAGQEALMAEWRSIRDEVVHPALARAPKGMASPTSTGISAGTLGTLVCEIPDRDPFRYTFTQDDVVWTARFLHGEAGGRDDLQNHSIIWTMFNRYAYFRNVTPRWGSFSDFIRQYSSALKPYLKHFDSVKKWVAKCNATFDNPECNFQPTRTEFYPGQKIPMGQLKNHLKLQRIPWEEMSDGSRQLATRALAGDVPNPIGNASDFANTTEYYRRKHNRRSPTRSEWEAFTRDWAPRQQRKLLWKPELVPYDQFEKNAIFIDVRAKDFPPNVTRIERGSGAAAPAQKPNGTAGIGGMIGATISAAAAITAAAARAGGDASRVLIYDGKTPAPGTTETRRSYPTNPPIKGSPSNRNRLLYQNVIDQFAVQFNPRYAHRKNPESGDTETFCNIFLWDVTRAMGVEIPFWANSSGEPVGVKEGKPLSANRMHDWLHKHGARFGWRRIDGGGAQAQSLANAGHPTIVVRKNPKPKRHGHVAVIRPGSLDDQGPEIAQAGSRNLNRTRVYKRFKRDAQSEFWGNWV